MSIELLSILFVAVFVVVLLTGLPLAFATGAVAVFFAVVLFGLPGLTLIVSRVFTLMGNYVLALGAARSSSWPACSSRRASPRRSFAPRTSGPGASAAAWRWR